jgi:hypothetical protein
VIRKLSQQLELRRCVERDKKLRHRVIIFSPQRASQRLALRTFFFSKCKLGNAISENFPQVVVARLNDEQFSLSRAARHHEYQLNSSPNTCVCTHVECSRAGLVLGTFPSSFSFPSPSFTSMCFPLRHGREKQIKMNLTFKCFFGFERKHAKKRERSVEPSKRAPFVRWRVENAFLIASGQRRRVRQPLNTQYQLRFPRNVKLPLRSSRVDPLSADYCSPHSTMISERRAMMCVGECEAISYKKTPTEGMLMTFTKSSISRVLELTIFLSESELSSPY